MKRSTDRILTTHVGSLVRTPAILEGMKARVLNRPYDQDQFGRDVERASRRWCASKPKSASTFRATANSGVTGFEAYISERLGGVEPMAQPSGEDLFAT